jgi:hypothetical protein
MPLDEPATRGPALTGMLARFCRQQEIDKHRCNNGMTCLHSLSQ